MHENGSGRNEQFLKKTFHTMQMLTTKFLIIWQSCFSGEDFLNEPIRNKNCLGWPCLLMDPNEMSNHNRGSPIDTYFLRRLGCFLPRFGSFGQSVSEEKNSKNQPISNKNRLWRLCLLTDLGRNEQSVQRIFQSCFITNFGLCNYAVSEEKIFFRNQPIRQKNVLWWPRLLTDQDEMSKFYRGPSIDNSYQDSVHLAKRFQW